jgi:hypothetical protein
MMLNVLSVVTCFHVYYVHSLIFSAYVYYVHKDHFESGSMHACCVRVDHRVKLCLINALESPFSAFKYNKI